MSLQPAYADHIETLNQRYATLLNAQSLDGVLIFSGSARQRFLDDQPFPFVANPHFKVWLPLARLGDSALLVRPGHKPLLYYCNPVDFWHMAAGAPQGFWTDAFDIIEVTEPQLIGGLLPQGTRLAFIGEEGERAEAWGISLVNPEALLHALNWQRAIKSDYEIGCLRDANRLAVLGHRAAERAFRQGASEFEIQQAYLLASGQRETELPYGNIIALNQHAAVLHYQHLDRQAPSQSHSFLIDAGAEVKGYAADITRTYAAQPGLFAEMVAALDQVQQRLVGAVQPGASFVDLHLQTHLAIGLILQAFGVVVMSPETQVEAGVTSVFYPHGLGHLLGLQVHDVGGLIADGLGTPAPAPAAHPFLRLTRPLAAEMVVTIEPGLYFIDSLLAGLKAGAHSGSVDWALVDRLRGYGGIRIEDNVRVTSDGFENLTREAFEA